MHVNTQLPAERMFGLHTHGRLSLLCPLTVIEISQVSDRQEQARDIRLFHIWCPTTPKERFPSAFPSDFQIAFGVKTVQKYKIFLNPKLPQQDFFKKMYRLPLSLYRFQKNKNEKMRK